MLKAFLKYLIYTTVILGASLIIARKILMSQIPVVERTIPQPVTKEEIPVPKRPGTQSIRIVGPPLKVLKFQIDFKRHPRPLDWDHLERIDKRADISVAATIDANGNLFIDRVIDKGHPKAGQYIKEILSSWSYLQYKTGSIRFYINVPTRDERRKLQIDLRGLEQNRRFVGYKDLVKDGMVYYVEGIGRNNITLLN